MKPLVVIPARGGSKGLPGKNIKKLNGKPLIQFTIEAAREVFTDELICVSTDDVNIKMIVEQLGMPVPFIRPEALATDNSSTSDVLLHAISFFESQGYFPDSLILLQPTSPFRQGWHIREAIALFDDSCEMVMSVKETKSNPYYILREESKDGWLEKSKEGNFSRRQDCPIVYEINGAIYIVDVDTLKSKPLSDFQRIRKYVMDEKFSLDIDSEFDWIMAESLLQNFHLNL